MKRILFVCLGNICRSPLAEGLFLQKLEQHNLNSQFVVDSAGTAGYHVGELPDSRTRANALQNGLKLQSRCRQFTSADFHEFDLILAMDRDNMRNILALEPLNENNKAKVMLMRDFDTAEQEEDVPDPYYGGDNGFQEVYEILDRCTEKLLVYLLKEQSKNAIG